MSRAKGKASSDIPVSSSFHRWPPCHSAICRPSFICTPLPVACHWQGAQLVAELLKKLQARSGPGSQHPAHILIEHLLCRCNAGVNLQAARYPNAQNRVAEVLVLCKRLRLCGAFKNRQRNAQSKSCQAQACGCGGDARRHCTAEAGPCSHDGPHLKAWSLAALRKQEFLDCSGHSMKEHLPCWECCAQPGPPERPSRRSVAFLTGRIASRQRLHALVPKLSAQQLQARHSPVPWQSDETYINLKLSKQ